MKSRIEHIMDLPVDKLIDVYTERNFIEEQFKKGGNDYVVSEFIDEEKLFRMTVDSHVEINSSSMPDFLKKIVGGRGVFTSMTEWDKSDMNKITGRTEMSMEGMPVSFIIRSTLEPAGAKTLHKSLIEIKARVPLVGKKIEKFMMPKAQRGAERSFKNTNDHIAALS